jgi:Ser/Thr protein kinase RdoA (MazF antagonist)
VCKLHRHQLPCRRVQTIAEELKLLQERLDIVAAQRPAWQGRLADLAAACARLAADLPVVSPRPIHRDFYHDQILLDGERLWLVDLDLLCAGDPALDAGNFVGHLLEWAVRSPADQPALAKAASAFTDRYVELTVDEAGKGIDTYTTLTLARHVFISTQFPDRTPFTETILNLCEARCGLARTVARGAAFANSTI